MLKKDFDTKIETIKLSDPNTYEKTYYSAVLLLMKPLKYEDKQLNADLVQHPGGTYLVVVQHNAIMEILTAISNKKNPFSIHTASNT